MNGLSPDAMSAEERLDEISLLLCRAIIRRRQRILADKTRDLSTNSLDFGESSRIPVARKTKERPLQNRRQLSRRLEGER